MDLNAILSQLESNNEQETEELLRQYNREVRSGSAFFSSRQPKQTAALTLAS